MNKCDKFKSKHWNIRNSNRFDNNFTFKYNIYFEKNFHNAVTPARWLTNWFPNICHVSTNVTFFKIIEKTNRYYNCTLQRSPITLAGHTDHDKYISENK